MFEMVMKSLNAGVWLKIKKQKSGRVGVGWIIMMNWLCNSPCRPTRYSYDMCIANAGKSRWSMITFATIKFT